MRSGLLVGLFIAALAVATATSAQEAAQEGDAPALEACLNAVREPSIAHGRTCVGVVSGPCVQAGGYSTMEMVRCMQRERHAWRSLTERYVANLHARESQTQIAQLNIYLTESGTWRAAHCAYQASRYEGGSLAGLTGEACHTENFAEVAIVLHGRVWDYDH